MDVDLPGPGEEPRGEIAGGVGQGHVLGGPVEADARPPNSGGGRGVDHPPGDACPRDQRQVQRCARGREAQRGRQAGEAGARGWERIESVTPIDAVQGVVTRRVGEPEVLDRILQATRVADEGYGDARDRGRAARRLSADRVGPLDERAGKDAEVEQGRVDAGGADLHVPGRRPRGDAGEDGPASRIEQNRRGLDHGVRPVGEEDAHRRHQTVGEQQDRIARVGLRRRGEDGALDGRRRPHRAGAQDNQQKSERARAPGLRAAAPRPVRPPTDGNR